MKRTFEIWMYGLTMRGDWLSDIVGRLWFHFYCPYPRTDDYTARACNAVGSCGCSNQKRLAPAAHTEEE